MNPRGVGGGPDPKDTDAAAATLEQRLFPGIGPGIRLGLDRVDAALGDLGRPHRRYPALQVGGTNGKGSVATVWASVLQAQGFRVGLYTSPHLRSFRERFVVAGEAATQGELEEGAALVRPVADRHGLSFFEASTALAFHLFAQRGVDVAVLEVGLGGRLDATSVAHPMVTAVTNVALDHRAHLGDTLEEVAGEKVGIARRGVPFVTAEAEPSVREVLRRGARDAGAPFRVLDPGREVVDLVWGPRGTVFRLDTAPWGVLRLESPLVGSYQATNVALALRALEYLPPELMPERSAVLEGVRIARNPGRLQVERRHGLTWLLDVAHNPSGARSLAESLGGLHLPEPRVYVVGVMADKDWRGILEGLEAPVESVVLTVPPSAPPGRGWDPREVARALSSSPAVEMDFARALERAGRQAAPGGTVVVTGSFHTVGDALAHLGRPPWPQVAGSVAADRG